MSVIVHRSGPEAPTLDATPHHYLKGLVSLRRPRRFVVLDTEAERHQINRDQEVQTFRLAVASHDKTRSDQGHRPSTAWGEFHTPMALWEWVTKRAVVGETLWVFAHNLQYDVLVSDAVARLGALGWKLDDLDAPGRLRTLWWRRGRRRLVLVDTFSLFRLPLDRVAELVGMEKLPMPGAGQREGKWLDYCRRDVEVLRAAVLGLLDFLDDEGLGAFQTTLPAIAWTAYRHRFMTTPPLVHRVPEVLGLERAAYFGGRAEVLQHGELTGGLWEDWDIVMCYPHVAATTALPYHYVGAVENPDWASWETFKQTHAILAEVTVTTNLPLVPSRNPEGVAWSVGTFRTTLWDPELRLLEEHGATIEWRAMHLYRRGHVLQKFAQWTIDKMHGEHPETDPLRLHLIKGMSRMVVGKAGQRSRQLVPANQVAQKVWGEYLHQESRDATPRRMVAVNGVAYEIDTSGEPENALPSLAGYITSVARVWLYNLIKTVGRDNVVYCDTDGIIVNREGADRLEEARARGAMLPMEIKGAYRRVIAWGPQDVELDDTHVIKGLPSKATRTGPDTFELRHFTTWSEAMAAGRLDRVTVTTRTIRYRRLYKRGWLLDDGRVWPLVLAWDGERNRILPWTSTPWCHLGRQLVDPRQAAYLGRDPPPTLLSPPALTAAD